MKTTKMITVEVTADGEVRVEAHGLLGGMCDKATAEIEKALGVASGPRKRKPEFYQQQGQQQQH